MNNGSIIFDLNIDCSFSQKASTLVSLVGDRNVNRKR